MGGFSLTSDVCASAALPKRAIASAHTPTDKRLLMLLSLREVVPGVVAQPRSEFLGHESVLLPRSSKWKDRTSDWHDRKGARLEISQARDDLFNLFARRVRPRLKRMAPIPISSGTCIAFNTGESSTDPEWQAEPVEAATPFNPLKIVEPV